MARSWFDIRVIGSKELTHAFAGLGREGIQAQIIQPSLAESLALVERDVRAAVPRRSGLLADSIRVKIGRTSGSVSAGNVTAYYAPFVEHGTRHARAQPFMRPALDNNRRTIEGIFERHVSRAVAALGLGGRVATTGGRGRWLRRLRA